MLRKFWIEQELGAEAGIGHLDVPINKLGVQAIFVSQNHDAETSQTRKHSPILALFFIAPFGCLQPL